jgi:hypothetical protein
MLFCGCTIVTKFPGSLRASIVGLVFEKAYKAVREKSVSLEFVDFVSAGDRENESVQHAVLAAARLAADPGQNNEQEACPAGPPSAASSSKTCTTKDHPRHVSSRCSSSKATPPKGSKPRKRQGKPSK